MGDDSVLGGLKDFAFGSKVLKSVAGPAGSGSSNPDSGPVDPAPLLKRNEDNMLAKQAAEKARGKRLTAPKTTGQKSGPRKTY